MLSRVSLLSGVLTLSLVFGGVVIAGPSPAPSPSSDAPSNSNPSLKYFDAEAACNEAAKKQSFNSKETGNFTNPCDKEGKQYHPAKIESQTYACAFSPQFGNGMFKPRWALYRSSYSAQGYSVAVCKGSPCPSNVCSSQLYSTGAVSQERAVCSADNSSPEFYDSNRVDMSQAPQVVVEPNVTQGVDENGRKVPKCSPSPKVRKQGKQSTRVEAREKDGNRCKVTVRPTTTVADFNPLADVQWRVKE